MSFFRPADSPATYADDPFASNSGFTLPRFNSGKQLYNYSPECDVYGPVFFPSPSISGTDADSSSGHHFGVFSPSVDSSILDFGMVQLENVDSGHAMELDENEFRLKLQEIEHALLDDGFFAEQSPNISISDDWAAEPVDSALLSNSPKDSSPESTVITGTGSLTGEERTLKQMLFECAAAIARGTLEEANSIITELRQSVAIQGVPEQRLAAYLVEGLVARITISGGGIYKSLRCKEQPTSYQLSAMQILFEICPCFRFGFTVANYAIIEASRGEDAVHIVDFDINQGSQYFTLIQSLSNHTNRPRRLRITGVDDPESVQRSVGGLKIVGQRLEKLAEDCNVPFEFQAVGAKIGDVVPSMLDRRPGEALVVNFAFELHHLPDESVSMENQRDKLLRMVKGLQPKLVTVVEQDANTNTAPFLARFGEVYSFYSALFDSLDATLPRESEDRMNVERQCLAREIVNILACEGSERIERYEVAGKWRARMAMAGFKPSPFGSNVITGIQSLLKSYCNRYKFAEDSGGLHFGWGDKSLVVASAWR